MQAKKPLTNHHKHTIMKLNHWTLGLAALGLISVASVAQADGPATGVTNAPTLATTNAIAASTGPTDGSKPTDGFFTRLDKAYREQLGQPAFEAPATNAPAPPRRGNPPPFDSPPYPTGEWQIGGTPIIGDPNTMPVYPLMQALQNGPHGDFWKDSKVQIYGWVDTSGNISSSHNTALGQGANFPEIYDQRPNRMELNQFVLLFERTPDEFQTDHVDWGFRIANVYGLDYRYMISRGYLSDQLLKSAPGVIGQPAGNPGNYYGFDMPMMYADLYLPWIAQGMNIRIGRIISEADIEAQLAPNNPMSSHSLLYSFDPYTQWGVFTTTKLNTNWTVQAGLAAGNDVAPWETSDPGCQPTGTVMLQYQSSNNKFSFYGGANAFNNGEFGYNNIQQYVGTLSYKFTEKIWVSHETWYMFQHHSTTAPTLAVPYQNGSFPSTANGFKGGYAPEWATLNYLMFRTGPSTFLTIRNEVFDDIVGNRTGFATLYTEHAIGLTWWPDKIITFRPELRYEHSYNAAAYDNGTRNNQFTAQFDVIVHF
jgi:Putative beta-barrel porin-2, OmpL-like. bbp2